MSTVPTFVRPRGPNTPNQSENICLIEGVSLPYAPTSVRFNYRAKIAKTETLGGKVIQVFGTVMDDVSFESQFRDAEQQDRWLHYMSDLMKNQASRSSGMQPVYTIEFPLRRWTLRGVFTLFQQVNGAAGAASVYHEPGLITRQFRLGFSLQDQPSELEAVAADDFISRLAEGFGWEQTEYNGPLGTSAVDAFLNGVSLNEYIALQYLPGGYAQLRDVVNWEAAGHSQEEIDALLEGDQSGGPIPTAGEAGHPQ